MTTRKNVWTPFLFALTLAIGMFLGFQMRNQMPGKGFFQWEKARPIQEVLDLIQRRYVDSVDVRALSDTAIQALLAQLDPHSIFIPAEQLQEVNEDIEGHLFGIGIEYLVLQDTLTVLQVVPDGPSAKAGLRPGDQVIRVNDSSVAGKKITSSQARKLLQGELGTSVKLNVMRDNKLIEFSVKRGIIPLTSVDAAYPINDTTGYIRLNKFSKQTYREFMIELDKQVKAGIKALVLDLRGNGGGVLDEATSIADEFLEGDKLITYTQGRQYARKEYRCQRPGLFEKGKLIVLCDEGTASASEVLIGALQDWDRATVIGRRSFGKGLVQEQFDLSDGSAIRLTIARYYTPLGRSIQRAYTPGQRAAYFNDITQRYEAGEAYGQQAAVIDSSRTFTTRNGKKLYGGGGILPDKMIPADTVGYTTATAKMTASTFLYGFSSRYFAQEQESLRQQFPAPDSFVKHFSLREADWMRIQELARLDSITTQRLSAAEQQLLGRRIRATIARQLWGDSGYFRVLNAEDRVMQEALNLLR